MRRQSALASLGLLAAAVAGTYGAGTQVERPTAPLPVSAYIVEIPPIRWNRIAEREVRLVIGLAGSPACAAGSSLEYGFLVDRDRKTTTGLTAPQVANFGADARLSFRCDPASGRFASALGPVNLISEEGRPVLTLRTTVQQLPSVDFRWMIYMKEGEQTAVVPGPRPIARWAIAERSMF